MVAAASTITEEQRAWLALSLVPGVGYSTCIQLLSRFGSAEDVLKVSQRDLQEVVGRQVAETISKYREVVNVERQIQRMQACGAWLVTLNDTAYPTRLAEIYDPPLLLFGRGTLLESDQTCVAIVGTRRGSHYGVRVAEQLAGDLARRGITVVSGMAEGIDTAAHRGALKAGGRTIAVLGCGVDICYPAANRDLMDNIIRNGCVLSTFEMGRNVGRGHFPHRNRILSGLTLGVVVVEAPARSGALLTAKFAAEQGREVFAVPGAIDHPNSAGPHALIREGAKLVETVEHILEELPELTDLVSPRPQFPSVRHSVLPAPGVDEEDAEVAGRVPARNRDISANEVRKPLEIPEELPSVASSEPIMPKGLSEVEQRIVACLPPDGLYVDEIADQCQVSVAHALSLLTLLELKGAVRQLSGKRFAPR